MKYITCPHCGANGEIDLNKNQTFTYEYSPMSRAKKVSCHKCLNKIGMILTQK